MTPEQQRIALAEWAEWQYSPDADSSIKHKAIMAWYRPGNSPWQLELLPDYLNDLNAVHELEGKLTDTQYVQWALALNELWLRDNPHPIPNRVGIFRSASATAAQRCEALLKTLNLWKA